MRVLVAGGAGYIGSHVCVALADRGHEAVVVDNLGNASAVAVERVSALTGRTVELVVADVRDREAMAALLRARAIEAVVHCAALKAVGESVRAPLRYYDNNVGGTLALLQAMHDAATGVLVFSSSATVYRSEAGSPIAEDAPLGPVNPYGWSKLFAERAILDHAAATAGFAAASLRYFNPIGAHPGGRIGEDPRGEPDNLLPYVAQVAVGRRPRLRVFGGDWPTPDGTGVRDYVHVMDLAEAHVAAIEALAAGRALPPAINLGTGRGTSVLEVVRAFAEACGREIPYEVVDRRHGDVAQLWADPALAADVLGWRASRDVAAMCVDAWRWQSANPNGYA